MMEGRLRTMRREKARPATVLGARARAERLWNEAVARPCAPTANDACTLPKVPLKMEVPGSGRKMSARQRFRASGAAARIAESPVEYGVASVVHGPCRGNLAPIHEA